MNKLLRISFFLQCSSLHRKVVNTLVNVMSDENNLKFERI